MLSVKAAAAAYAGVSESLVRGWVASGQLTHFRLGAKGRRAKIAIGAEDLSALLASFRVGPVGPELGHRPPPDRAFKHLRIYTPPAPG